MFKVGDRVKVLTSEYPYYEIGDEGYVNEVGENGHLWVDFSIYQGDRVEGDGIWCVSSEAIELIEPPTVRTFETGATRDSDEDKLDYEGFLSPAVLKRYAQYLYKHRKQSDGQLRSSDNWQNGIPKDVYMKSLCRHFFAAWEGHREGEVSQEDLCGILFNTMGYLFEELKLLKSCKSCRHSIDGEVTQYDTCQSCDLLHSNWELRK